MNRVFHKQKARSLLATNLTGSLLVACIPIGVFIISLVAELAGITLVSNALTIVNYLLMPLTATLTILFVKDVDFVIKDKLNEDVDKNLSRYVGTMGLTYLYTILWTLLFIVPGIIKSYSYYLVPYILADNPKLSYNEAIDESRRLMDGQKMEVFIFDFSFFLWYMLVGFTFGIAGFYVLPYVHLATASLYLDIKNTDLTERGLQPEPTEPTNDSPQGPVVVTKEAPSYKEEPFTLEEVELEKTIVEEQEPTEEVVVETVDVPTEETNVEPSWNAEDTLSEETIVEPVTVEPSWKTVEPMKKVETPKTVEPLKAPKEVEDIPTSTDDLKK